MSKLDGIYSELVLELGVMAKKDQAADPQLHTIIGGLKAVVTAKQKTKALMLEIVNSIEPIGPPHPQTDHYRGTLQKAIEDL